MKKKYHSKYVEVLNDTSRYIQKALKGDAVPQLDDDKPSWLTTMASVICEAQTDVITATKFNWKIKKTDYKRLALSVLDVPYWIEVIICLNNDLWENLQDFKWGEATQNWSNDVTKVIIDCLDCEELKVPVLQCMIEAWRVADNGANIDLTKWGEQRFDGFCKNLISHIQNHGLYSIEAIKVRQNDRLKAVEDRVSRLELPTELQSSEAQALLKRAVEAGLCKPDGQGRYKWLNDIQLCAYFCVKMSGYLELSKRVQNNKLVANWKPFVALFGYSADQLKSAKQGYSKDGRDKPTDHKTVDDLFGE